MTELDMSARTLALVRWEPALVFEIMHQLVRVFKAVSVRKDADKSALSQRITELQSELTVLDPACALAISPQS